MLLNWVQKFVYLLDYFVCLQFSEGGDPDITTEQAAKMSPGTTVGIIIVGLVFVVVTAGVSVVLILIHRRRKQKAHTSNLSTQGDDLNLNICFLLTCFHHGLHSKSGLRRS